LENAGIPTDIGRDTTYITTESYLFDVLACHDNHLVHQLNAVNDEDDCRAQMAALATMRAVLPRFIRRDLRRGPFLFTLTDLHQSNIFVDDDWNVKYLIDLEWACSLPIEMQHPPYWLTSQSVDGLVRDRLTLFEEVYREFLDIFAREEALLLPAAPGEHQHLYSIHGP
jgi:Ser/Thr protein kinase RdoA (MazF antagonist)